MKSEYLYKEVTFSEEVIASDGKHIKLSARRVRDTGSGSFIILHYGQQSIEFAIGESGDRYEEHARTALKLLEDAINDPCAF